MVRKEQQQKTKKPRKAILRSWTKQKRFIQNFRTSGQQTICGWFDYKIVCCILFVLLVLFWFCARAPARPCVHVFNWFSAAHIAMVIEYDFRKHYSECWKWLESNFVVSHFHLLWHIPFSSSYRPSSKLRTGDAFEVYWYWALYAA